MPSRNLVLRILLAEMPELQLHLRPATFERGDQLAESGETVTRLFFPVGGIVSCRAIFETDHEMELVTLGCSSVAGVLAALGFPRSLTRDVCITQAHGWAISVGEFKLLLDRSPKAEEVIRGASYAQMTYAVRMATCNAMHTAEQRLARWLLIANALLNSHEIRMPQEELANILGIRRSHLNPLLQRLRAAKVIELGRQKIIVADSEALKRRSCGCDALLQRIIGVSAPTDDISAIRFQPAFKSKA